mmetsp:Transcript_23925/g.71479  ORF Transcript_23925/g.71479 Transcript_23925/m.71479 type:complete len:120 (+) Transcript_23925:317-676(+)
MMFYRLAESVEWWLDEPEPHLISLLTGAASAERQRREAQRWQEASSKCSTQGMSGVYACFIKSDDEYVRLDNTPYPSELEIGRLVCWIAFSVFALGVCFCSTTVSSSHHEPCRYVFPWG